MLVILHALGIFICDLLKSRCRPQAENLFLRPKINLDNIGLGCAEWLSPHLGLRDRGSMARQKTLTGMRGLP